MPEPRPGSEEIIENVVFLVNKKPDFNRGISSQTSIEDIIKVGGFEHLENNTSNILLF